MHTVLETILLIYKPEAVVKNKHYQNAVMVLYDISVESSSPVIVYSPIQKSLQSNYFCYFK